MSASRTDDPAAADARAASDDPAAGLGNPPAGLGNPSAGLGNAPAALGNPPAGLDTARSAGLAEPRSPGELFVAFTLLALQGFGGVLAVAQHELVERKRWLTKEQFVEMLSVSQVLPGPNVVNLALMFGDRFFGLRGAFAAVGGMLLVPLAIVLALTVAYAEFARVPAVAGALRGMGVVAAGLVIATAMKLAGSLGTSRLGRPLAATLAVVTFVAIAWLRWPLVGVVVGLGAASMAIAWRRWR